MPGNPRAIITEAEHRFPGTHYGPMTEWLDENCGLGGWSITPAGTRGVLNDAIAVYVNGPTCAVAYVARWCVPGDPPGFYEFREDEPERRVPAPHHKTP
jgi:hypothetical protein